MVWPTRTSLLHTGGSLRLLLAAWVLAAACCQGEPAVPPYEVEGTFVPANGIDEIMLAAWRKQGVAPALRCSDEVFLRRAYLDLIGTLPTPAEGAAFRRDRRPDKRATLVETLLARREFADYWSLKWCDVLRVKAEFPVNLWPNAVQAYHRWIRDAIRDGKPYDRFARELLASSGSNFRVPPVNFYRAMQGHEPATIARSVALTMMGTRIDSWPKERREGMEAFFSRVAFKPTAEWKEEIVHLDPAAVGPLHAVFPDGSAATIPSGTDPRLVFADWLLRPDNPWFARAAANRQWFWLMGRGVIDEADDIRPDNPPAVPGLLEFLAGELVAAKYDTRHLLRLIVSSRTYQQSPIPQDDPARAEALFACYPVRQLDAEVLVDALVHVFGPGESYSSPIPEPFTFVPENQRTILLADGSITSQFLEMFGRPSRDTGTLAERSLKSTAGQRLHMLNSTHVQRKIEGGWALKGLALRARRQPDLAIGTLYESILSRPPAPLERIEARGYFDEGGVTAAQAVTDLAWALVNTKEFLYRH